MVKDIIVGVIRQMISAGLGAWTAKLAQTGVATEAQVLIAIGVVATFLVNIAWTVGERFLRRWNLTAALEMGAGSTHSDLRSVVSQVSLAQRIKEGAQLPDADLHEQLRQTVERTMPETEAGHVNVTIEDKAK